VLTSELADVRSLADIVITAAIPGAS